MTVEFGPGDTVLVQRYDARVIEGVICAGGILTRVDGIKVRVQSGDAVYLVDAKQIIQVKAKE